ncbi:MAG: NADPH-dependent F420 reductase [Gammaproteobacteria bacterium]
MNKKKKTISVLGGTGNLGIALAWRWATAGYPIIIGSRDESRAQEAAAQVNARIGRNSVKGAVNPEAARDSEIVVLTVPFRSHQSTLETIKAELAGQIFIDTTVPIQPPRVDVVQLPKAGAVALETRTCLGEKARVAAAFHNISANLLNMDKAIHSDVLVTADDDTVRQEVMKLVEETGCRGLDAGVLANSAAAEAMTSVLIHLNKTYKVGHAGLLITGLDK